MHQNPQIESSVLNGELLLFDGTTNKFFVMNPTAAFVWERTRQPIRDQEMASALFAHFNGTMKEQAPKYVKERELGLLLD